MIAVFLDSNVLLSSLIGSRQSAPVLLVDWLSGSPSARLVSGQCCVEEVERNLARKLPQARPLWEQFLLASGIEVLACPHRTVRGINAKDEAVVAAAVTVGATYFVTGDRRLIAEMRAAKVPLPQVMTPREMLDMLVQQG